MENTIKNLTSILNQFKKSKNMFQIFSDVMEICSISEHQHIYNLGWKPKDDNYKLLEKKYLELINDYEKPDRDLMVKFYSTLKIFFMQGNYGDVLGEVYMNLELGNKRNGQFFTPYHISKLMAEITMSGIEEAIRNQGYFSASDPCSGAGGMLIAASDLLKTKNIAANLMIFQAIDIDRLCFNMSYTQLSMLRLNGVLIWGDSLKCEVFETRATPALILSSDKNKNSHILKSQMEDLTSHKKVTEHPKPAKKQLSLF